MTQAEWIQQQRGKIETLLNETGQVIAGIHAESVRRIFGEGGLGDSGTQQKDYSKSYAEFRAKKGRQTAFVDLRFTGDLERDYANSLTRIGERQWVVGTKRQKNTAKALGNIERFGRFTNLTKEENETLIEKLKERRSKIGI